MTQLGLHFVRAWLHELDPHTIQSVYLTCWASFPTSI